MVENHCWKNLDYYQPQPLPAHFTENLRGGREHTSLFGKAKLKVNLLFI